MDYEKLQKLAETYGRQEIYNARYAKLGIEPSETQKIPAILHHIWLTNSVTPKDISMDNIEEIKHIAKLLARDDVNSWQIVIWTNNLNAFGTSMKELESSGVKFRSIAELKLNEEMEANINYAINHQYWGMASDALRYLIVSQYGGMYADLGAEFYRAPGLDLYRYDLFTNQWADQLITNNFFAAKMGHPALNITSNIVEENLTKLCEDNPTLPINEVKDITTELTAEPFNIGFYYDLLTNFKDANGLINVVIPHSRFHNNKNLIFDGIDPTEPQKCMLSEDNHLDDICAADHLFIGQDALAGETWYQLD